MPDESAAASRLLGADLGAEVCRFTVWAPRATQVEVVLTDSDRAVSMEAVDAGYHVADVGDVGAGDRYRFRLDGGAERPDPASRHQPDGVHGPSVVVDREWDWTDTGWAGVALEDLVIYELHVGTYTAAGTFDAVIEHLRHLRELGVTAIELMPVSQFPGHRNWGYDGVGLYAAQHSYGGPDGLRRLVEAAHSAGLGVLLDVVYNHFGPEGNYLSEFGPYLTDRYRTPWGDAVNVDGPGSDEVRRFFIENAVMWVRDHHVDGFRLDAVHSIADRSAHPFLEEIAAAIDSEAVAHNRDVLVIAEDGDNDPRISRPVRQGGLGLSAQWNDDFHHALHVAFTGERDGYYRDFSGLDDLATVLREGYVFGNRHSVHRGHRVGRPAHDTEPERLVVFGQNHDQIGNRAGGERLVTLVGADAARAAAALVVLAPGIPLLFMGEEWADPAPFWYFIDHSDPQLVQAVRRGRRKEFAFDRGEEIPDPADPATFEKSRIDHQLAEREPGRRTIAWYRDLLSVRRDRLVHGAPVEVVTSGTAIGVEFGAHTALAVNTGARAATVKMPLAQDRWSVHLDSGDPRYGGRVRSSVDGQTVVVRDGGVVLDLEGWAAVVLVPEDGT